MTHPDFQGAARFWPISMRTFVELPDGGDGAYHDPDDILCPYHDPLSLDVPPYVHALSWPGPLACRCRTHHVVNLFVLYPHAPGHHLAVALASTLPVALNLPLPSPSKFYELVRHGCPWVSGSVQYVCIAGGSTRCVSSRGPPVLFIQPGGVLLRTVRRPTPRRAFDAERRLLGQGIPGTRPYLSAATREFLKHAGLEQVDAVGGSETLRMT